MKTPPLSRREFIKLSLISGSGLLLGVQVIGCSDSTSESANEFKPNLWLEIHENSSVTITISKAEMGQGVITALAMLVAEELDADWSKVHFVLAKTSDIYGNMATAGSMSVTEMWEPLRTAGAAAREMLLNAAAKKWQIAPSNCRTENAYVIDTTTAQRISYGDLIANAVLQTVPQQPRLKNPDEFRIVGQSLARLDARIKITGEARYGIDQQIPGLKHAAIRQAPVFGASVLSVDSASIKNLSGILDVVVLDNAVAVVADTYWQAQTAVDLLKIKWSNELSELSDALIQQEYKQLLDQPGTIEMEQGNSITGESLALQADYEAAFQAHAAMEPMNCTAHVHADGCEAWAPTQHAQYARDKIKAYLHTGLGRLLGKVKDKLGMESENIIVHNTLMGGGFGRRLEPDFVIQAVEISRKSGFPVKLLWSREEDIRHDFYRPYTSHRLQAKVTNEGKVLAWQHRIVGPTHGRSVGGATHLPYDVAYARVDYHVKKHSVPIGSWRSIGSSHNAFVMESFVDELAAKIGKDPYQFRKDLLADNQRVLAVLNKVAELSNWGSALAKGQSRGIAIHAAFNSITAQVAEVSVEQDEVKVHRVYCVVDCGLAVNPQIIVSQIESGIAFGLSATLKSEINIKNGGVIQSNFHNFSLLKFSEMPDITVHIMKSIQPPGGIGEVAVPPIAPAVCNAVYALTGKRIRRIPITPEMLKG